MVAFIEQSAGFLRGRLGAIDKAQVLGLRLLTALLPFYAPQREASRDDRSGNRADDIFPIRSIIHCE